MQEKQLSEAGDQELAVGCFVLSWRQLSSVASIGTGHCRLDGHSVELRNIGTADPVEVPHIPGFSFLKH